MKQPLFAIAIALATLGGSNKMRAAEAQPELLWPAGAPSAIADTPADQPTLTIFRPPAELANGTAVVICPGGGYRTLMMSYEGREVAQWLNQHGIAGILLKYRVNPYLHPAPFQDGQRALRTVRARASELGINPERIGMMGFSAGGHLASVVGTQFDAGIPSSPDPIERVSDRPDFLVLIYPVISMDNRLNGGTTKHLLGDSPPAELIELLSSEKRVTPQTPPTFLAHAKTDQLVSFENSARFAAACQSNHVPVEYFELDHGSHGLGLGKGADWAAWQEKCLAWLKSRGLM